MSKVKGKIVPLKNKVIVHNMNFGERRSTAGIILTADDGKDSGIRPRWGQVYAKGSENTDEYQVGDWILVEHGRWTRGIELEKEDGSVEVIRMVDNDCILMWNNEPPESEGT
jgi:co-chaperonin GroES (HSP10)